MSTHVEIDVMRTEGFYFGEIAAGSRVSVSVSDFDTKLRLIAAQQPENGGYNKVRGTFVFGGSSISFRFDVDRKLSEGRSLADRMMKLAKFWDSENGRDHARKFPEAGTADEGVKMYQGAALAALEAAA